MRLLALLAVAAVISACQTNMEDIRNREIQDDVVVSRSVQQIRDCLVSKLSSWRTPVETGNDHRKEIAFASEAAGMIFHYTLTATANGTKVEARRKNNIAPGFNSARECYSEH
jgi:hypothetical protein